MRSTATAASPSARVLGAGHRRLCPGPADPRRRTGLAAVCRARAFRRRTGRVRAVKHRRALRIRRTGMEPITAGGGQRDRRSAHRGIRCGLYAEQPHQNPITLTALIPDRGCDNGAIDRSPTASISLTDPPESLPLWKIVPVETRHITEASSPAKWGHSPTTSP